MSIYYYGDYVYRVNCSLVDTGLCNIYDYNNSSVSRISSPNFLKLQIQSVPDIN